MFSWLLTPIYLILKIVRQNQEILLEQKDTLAAIQAELAFQRKLLMQILKFVTPPPATQVVFVTEINGTSQEIERMKIKVKQQFTVAAVFKDKYGNIAQVDGVPAWTNDNDSVLAMQVAGDGIGAIIGSPNGTGSGQISVVADADLGTGATELTGTLSVEVLAGDATVIELNPGEVTDLLEVNPENP